MNRSTNLAGASRWGGHEWNQLSPVSPNGLLTSSVCMPHLLEHPRGDDPEEPIIVYYPAVRYDP